MTTEEKKNFILAELYHELRCLLGSATVGRIFSLNDRGYEVVIAQDSVFLHARILFEFFTSKKANPNILRVTEFGPSKYSSTLYSKWKMPLNRHVLHLNKQRSDPKNQRNEGHLNEQAQNFANEILKLWVKFETDPRSIEFHDELRTARLRAVADAKNDAGDRIEPIFK